jgi:hypothetical protein
MRRKVASKGFIVYCKHCKTPLARWNRDVYEQEQLTEDMIDCSESPVKYKNGERVSCPDCHKDTIESFIKFKE